MSDLTPRQAEVLAVVWAHWAEHGRSPSYRDVGRALGITSPNGVMAQLVAMARKGAIELAAGDGRLVFPAGFRDRVKALARECAAAPFGRCAACNYPLTVVGLCSRPQCCNAD